MPHEVRIESDLAIRTLYLDRETSAPLGPHCKVLFVSTLVRELVLEVVRAYQRRDRSERIQLVTRLLLGELRHAERSEIHIPSPSDARLQHVCRRVLDDPSRKVTLDVLAYDAGASSRTHGSTVRARTEDDVREVATTRAPGESAESDRRSETR